MTAETVAKLEALVAEADKTGIAMIISRRVDGLRPEEARDIALEILGFLKASGRWKDSEK